MDIFLCFLLYLLFFDSNFAIDSAYVHTDNNCTTELKTKLQNVNEDGEANIIETIKVSGNALIPIDKTVNIDLTAYRTEDLLQAGQL